MVNTKPVNIGPFQNIVEVGWGNSFLLAAIPIERLERLDYVNINAERKYYEDQIGYWLCQNSKPWPSEGKTSFGYLVSDIKFPGSWQTYQQPIYEGNNIVRYDPVQYYARTPTPFEPSSHVYDPGWFGQRLFLVYDLSYYYSIGNPYNESDLGEYIKESGDKWGVGNKYFIPNGFGGQTLQNGGPFNLGSYDIGCQFYEFDSNGNWFQIDYNNYKSPNKIIPPPYENTFMVSPLEGGYLGHDFSDAERGSGTIVHKYPNIFQNNLPNFQGKYDPKIFEKFPNYDASIKWVGNSSEVEVECLGSNPLGPREIFHTDIVKYPNHPIADPTEVYPAENLNWGRWKSPSRRNYIESNQVPSYSWGSHTLTPSTEFTMTTINDKTFTYQVVDVGASLDNQYHTSYEVTGIFLLLKRIPTIQPNN